MLDFWDTMVRIYGSQFISQYGMPETQEGITEPTYLAWSASLSEFTPQQIIGGVNRLIKNPSRFAPNLGTVRLSITESLYPDVRDAYKEACNKSVQPLHKKWSHVVVYTAGNETGFYELRSSKESEILKIFEKKYFSVCARHRDGEKMIIPAPEEKRIPAFVSSKLNRKRAGEKAISEMKAMLKMMDAKNGE